MDKSRYSGILGNFGVPNYTLTVSLNVIFLTLRCYSLKHLQGIMGVGKMTKRIVREVIAKMVVKNKSGNNNPG